MKRILSILLSVTIIATMLVSMSVTSFAADKVLYTDTTPSEDVKFEIFFEKCDDATNTDMGLENGYLVTYTLSDYGTVNGWRASGKFNGTKLAAFSVALLFEDGCVPTAAWVDSSDIGDFDADVLADAENYYEIVYGKPFGTAFPVVSSSSAQEHSEPLSVYAYIDMPTDTFKVQLGDAIGPNNVTQFAFVDASAGAQSGQPRVIGDENCPGTVFSFEFEHTYYVKDGVQVTKDEYEGGSSEPTVYTVTFKNGDSVLKSTDVEEGAEVTAPAEPSAPVDADEAYNYTFVGWSDGSNTYASDEIPAATDNVEYTAVFNSVKKTYTITFDVDGATTTQTVEYGETPSYAGTPSKEGYNFTGWDKDFAPATENTTYVAQFAIKTYTITFVVDGATTTKTVNHGETPDYGSTPSKAGYNFTGWDPAIVPATGAATYTAQFSEIPPTKYEITFVVDGVQTKVDVIEGQTPVYPNGTPAKDGYNFTGWDPAIVPATGAATYTAQFELIPVEPEGDAVTMGNVVYVDGTNGNILPGGADIVKVNPFGTEHTVKAAELLRVHTEFTYDSEAGTLKEMGMLFVPKAVAGGMNRDEIIAADITKDACCTNIPYLTGGGNVTFKAGLVDIPVKGIEIYAIPYYKLSGGERIYQAMQTILFD